MIVTALRGGLGNQLFQYATGRRLALINGMALKLDISKFQADSRRSYRLGHFNVQAEVASPEEAMQAKGGFGVGGKFKRRTDRLRPYYRRSWVKEKHYGYDSNILKIDGMVFLEGYWQSEKYFKDIEMTLRDEFTLKSSPCSESKKVAEEIQASSAVCVHVRRGDYLSDPIQRPVYSLCGPEYYRAAAAEIDKYVKAPYIYVFSDDPDWARKNIQFDVQTTYVGLSWDSKDYEDLWLMSLCKHHIIANSTFSWWGAWLGSHPGKIVVAPKQWSTYVNSDRIPDGWLQL